MRRTTFAFGFTCLIASLALARGAWAQDRGAQPTGQRQQPPQQQMPPEQLVAQWPAECQKAFREMQQKYGAPSGVTETRLVWTDKAPFKEIILLNEEFQHDFPKPHKDCLEHVVEFKVPVEKVGDLAKFDGSIIVDRTRGTLSARCDSEAHNIVALNLAHQIISGKLDVEKARQMYTEGAKQEMQGKMPELAQKLMFQPIPNGGDTDVATLGGSADEARPAGARQNPEKRDR
jgi:hypothetical protein